MALTALALSAHAADAYSNFGPVPWAPLYVSGAGYFVNRTQIPGAQFVSTATGALSGFQVAMNENDGRGPEPYLLSLYSDSGANTVGALLGTYSGLSTGDNAAATAYRLSSVAASGPAVTLASGTKYWLLASLATSADPDENLFWNTSIGSTGPLYSSINSAVAYSTGRTPAFSVQVQATPEPAGVCAFALGTSAMLRRRKRA